MEDDRRQVDGDPGEQGNDPALPLDESKGHDKFVMLVIESQKRLYAYALSLTLDRDRARDVVQQTNLVLLEKESDFRHGTDFFAWAARITYYEVLADRRRLGREKLLFSDELLSAVAEQTTAASEDLELKTEALQQCLATLSADHRELLMQRYRPDGSVAKIAKSMGKTPGAISAILHRLRCGLIDCVQRKLNKMARA